MDLVVNPARLKELRAMANPPELSIIVPVLNEADTLPALLGSLNEQESISFELVICDGGSSDRSAETAALLGNRVRFPLTVIASEPGRGRQLNVGAGASRGETILFLHADSRFAGSLALRSALDLLAEAITLKGDERVAGRFRLRFDRNIASPSLAYYYYETKARLDRRECTHGDQGFMLRRTFFRETGPFDEMLPMLAETRFAETVRQMGEWLLLPDEIFTSARRFEREGLFPRQMLNAFIMNAAAIEWNDFFREFPSIYASPGGKVEVGHSGMLRNIQRLIASLSLRRRLSLWQATGSYVLSHAWQIPFFLDVRRNFRRGIPPGPGPHPLLHLHDRRLASVIDNFPARTAAAALTWLWFRLTCLYFAVGTRAKKEVAKNGA